MAVHRAWFVSFASPRRGMIPFITAGAFALGLFAGAVFRAPVAPAPAAALPGRDIPQSGPAPLPPRADGSLAYPADVLRIIDGDTFEARVHVWPGLNVETKVRLRDIDAPELHARCSDELAKAQAARTALEGILAGGGVTLSRVGIDKYGGRVDARVATATTADVSAALLGGGYARSYDGRKRGTWC